MFGHRSPLADWFELPPIVLPTPPDVCDPNNSPHRMVKATKVKKYKDDHCRYVVAEWRSANQINRPWQWAAVAAHWFYGGKKRKVRDPDNLTAFAKAAIDSLTLGGVMSDDRELIHLPPLQTIDKAGRSEIEFYILPEPTAEQVCALMKTILSVTKTCCSKPTSRGAGLAGEPTASARRGGTDRG